MSLWPLNLFSDEGEVDAFAARLWHCFSGKQTFAATEVVLSATLASQSNPEDGTDINTILSKFRSGYVSGKKQPRP
ncbi:sensory box/GGDEF family protein [Klebsiella pneumoniae]|uniref:Sensory box/GGDEF family protein n=1 Tax=Klebsiella pneumoniae TaxID=573 RepID=A0A2X1QJG5_KLEPN|nr:sensory box/GGDEF family protein [Klebsiella pneumoniae]